MLQEIKFESEIKKSMAQLTQCDWVRDELSDASFGDRRLLLRYLVVANHLAKHPQAPINQASEVWKKAKAAYRFFDNKKVTAELVLRPHHRKTVERIKNHDGWVVIAQDTTYFNFSHMRESSDLGPIGDSRSCCRGLVAHNSLAMTEHGLPLGLIDQQIWARSVTEHGKGQYRKKKPIEEKESYIWIKALENYCQILPEESKVVAVCDAEADIYELFARAAPLHARLLVRATSDRVLEKETDKLWAFMERQKVAATDTVEISQQKDRPARTAEVTIKFAEVKIACPANLRPCKYPPFIRLWAIYVKEDNPPQDQDPLSWMLLTNIETKTASDAKTRIAWYKCRWQVEILHRIMKSGCKVERAQLEKNHRRLPYLAMNSIISWKLLLITHYSRIDPLAPANSLLTQTECDVLHSITHGKVAIGRRFNAKKATQWLAQLGGYMARNSDPHPGPTHVWRGWQRLQDFTHMYALTSRENKV